MCQGATDLALRINFWIKWQRLNFDDLLFIINLILMKSFHNRRVIIEWDVIYLVTFIFIECRLDQALFETS